MKITTTVLLLLVSYFGYSQNVGINTTGGIPSGSAMLDVASADKGLLIPRVDIVDLTTSAPVTTPVTSLLVYNTNTTTGVGYYYWDASKWVNLVDGNTATNNHDWYEVGTTTVPDNINDDIFTQGKVGIGIVNPSSSLQIGNGVSASNSIFISRSTNSPNLGVYESYDGVSDIVVQTGMFGYGVRPSDSAWQIWERGYNASWKNLLTVKNIGNIGVNTENPYNKLHIYDKIDGAFSGLVIDNRKTYGIGTGVNETSRMLLSLSEGGIQNPNGRVMAYIEGGVLSEVTSAEGYLALGTRLSGTETEKMRILNNGNVGIGTSTPDTKLTIQQASGRMIKTVSTSLVTANTSNNFIGGYDINDDRFWYLGDGSSTKRIILAAGSAVVTDYTLGFEVGGVNRLHIETNGNIGVGTTSPTEKLEINGSIKITDGTQGAGKVLVSDANGKGSWQNTISAPTYVSPVFNTGQGVLSFNTNLSISTVWASLRSQKAIVKLRVFVNANGAGYYYDTFAVTLRDSPQIIYASQMPTGGLLDSLIPGSWQIIAWY